ncbi:protein LNK4 isoform X1 [Olea europaea var. sylvestris]|nr:protein LNK4 isoform X1 [Olea europaea var. sylvestris]XP_022864285.1 protein LNK4 isoform X1 [Olea europaea var. sylvestris]CAA3000287.1 Hypothetical predicted protein [Olea europaea subsp. europaea]
MDWYFGSDIEDLVVPNNKEMSDMIPSPYSLSPWENATFGSFNSPKKCRIAGTEELPLSGTTFSSEVDQLCSTRVCIGLQDDFYQWSTSPREQLDFQLNDVARFDEADDIFVQSLLEENGSGIHAASSVNFSPTSSNEYMTPSNLSRDLISESKTVQDHIDNTGHSQDLEKYTFSASPDCKNEAKNDPFTLATAMEVDVPFSLEHNSADKHITEEKISLEESVYLELRSLTVQLTDNTRICIRDALYRLAKNSKHEETKQEGNEAPAECSPTAYSETSRLDDTDEEESTNAIDRTVANLLFHNINIYNPAATETEDEVKCCFYNHNPCFSISSHGAVPDGEAEVPIFDNGLSYSTKMVDGD